MRISDCSSDVCSSDLELRAQAFILPHDAAIVDEVHNTLEAAFRTNREIQHQRNCAKAIDDRLHTVIKIGASAVQFIYEAPSWRSEERRVGKECVSTCRSRWWPYHSKKKR